MGPSADRAPHHRQLSWHSPSTLIALKVLPDSFAKDPDRLARFQREAKTLAALNHPNIAHIHGLEERAFSDGPC